MKLVKTRKIEMELVEFDFFIGPVLRISGPICDRTTCVHGDCSKSGKCICHENWTSENCNQSLIISMFVEFINYF